ncbi:hypothetical protein [Sinorhizobium psoraleae]|uniref:Uncharacterized protein n=1 Tax=Sinorhizobium psoraleae TaxID=520838 RepID=A0ABT4KA58_9HYPH|nr:hypothetical protein [Sinorhizobium psoraleae]MCZ4088850.1 hypothetical protein [Sinorhizobium psoraleae]
MFAATYILYAKYLDPITKAPIELEQALEVLARMRAEQMAA